jgi:hypothetical protein
MKLLGNKTGKALTGAGASAMATPHPFGELEMRWTKELARTANLAVMLARSRALRSISPTDFLAAMYLNHWDGLSPYWEDSGEIEKYLARICCVSPQRWHAWLLEYDAGLQEGKQRGRGGFALRQKPRHRTDTNDDLTLSRELASVLRRAGRITPGRERQGQRTIPILTSESVLLAMAREPESQLGRRLEATGLDVGRLERATKDPRRAPIH